jgi:hypothetical protein
MAPVRSLQPFCYIPDFVGKGLLMQSAGCRAHCVNIVKITNSLGQVACVHCPSLLGKSQFSRDSPYA